MGKSERRRSWLRNALSAAIVIAGCLPAFGQEVTFERPLRFIVPYAPGGPADVIARTVADRLSVRLSQRVVVENRPGASGAIGAEVVARAKPDGHTLLLSNIGDTVLVALGTKTPYRFESDLTPVSLLGRTPFVLVTGPQSPVRTVKELVALGKTQPKGLTFGSSGTGSASQLAGELLGSSAGFPVVHVPYKGQAPATADLVGGQLTFMFSNPVTALPQVQAGALQAIAVSGRQRYGLLPDVPTVDESGVPGYDIEAWFGVMTTAETPANVVALLNREIVGLLAEPAVVERLARAGVRPSPTTAAEFAALIRSEIDRWSRVIKAANIRVE